MARLEANVTYTSTFDPARIRANVAGALKQFGDAVMEASQERVPVLTGALQESGRVDEPVEEGGEIAVTLSYGGGDVDYAAYVHENMTEVHWTRPGSGPKFLESPLKEMQGDLPDKVADAFRDGLE